MPQDINTMKFCNSCKMNVFPSRSKFNLAVFGACVLIMLPIVVIINIVFFSQVSWLLNFIFFMWGFMLLNPYLIYYGLKKKNYCPNCHNRVVEKNLEYQPFGDKQSIVYSAIVSSNKSNITDARKAISYFFCPYCGNRMIKIWKFCKTCGNKSPLSLENK